VSCVCVRVRVCVCVCVKVELRVCGAAPSLSFSTLTPVMADEAKIFKRILTYPWTTEAPFVIVSGHCPFEDLVPHPITPPPPHSLHSPAIKLVRKVLDELKGDLEGKEDSDLLEAEVVLRTKLFYFGRYRMLLVF